ncbi:FoF1 ATP synthase subunit delta/epsilon [Spiroplasma monobiae]|uniref:F0F1 ATP synthase subunit epsilon n=1 Tax=Spiroplasma monobiae MQ-1 TaxID=1336748 RepID=A0A2K9LT91_SPISQ|nr:F0F1 ATP synthase subunit epsilon [Spiroplasma monobiae]AUM62309.1 F0F1 ATP synthase subunit epsilon [Spiroplasma monobiae MQ-1]
MELTKLKIITPEGIYIDDLKVESVSVRTADGQVTVFANHSPIVSTLLIGDMKYELNGTSKYIHLHRGILQVSKEQVKILTQRLYEVDEQGRRLK